MRYMVKRTRARVAQAASTKARRSETTRSHFSTQIINQSSAQPVATHMLIIRARLPQLVVRVEILRCCFLNFGLNIL